MIRKCKGVDITDEQFIAGALAECLRPAKKRIRYDAIILFSRVLGIRRKEAKEILLSKGERYDRALAALAKDISRRIKGRNLGLKMSKTKRRFDHSSRKLRNITVLGIRQLLLDHVAVTGLSDLFKRVGEYQVSSIPGRGAAYGSRAIKKWLRESKGRLYSAKLDVKDFYGSMDRKRLMAWLRKRVANRDLLWLVEALVATIDRGMAIGSYLSQTLANIYMSDLYHRFKEKCFATRRGKPVPVFKHVMFYMDDMMLVGSNKRAMRECIADTVRYAKESLGLEIKENWAVHEVSAARPLDMMGFRYCAEKTSLRRRIYKYARRMVLRAGRMERRGKLTPLSFVRRSSSYYGFMLHTVSRRAGDIDIFKKMFDTIKRYDKGSLHRKASARQDRA